MKRSIINRLIRSFEAKASGPIQGSKEWLALRRIGGSRKRGRIGGSEIATLLGLNPYGNKRSLMFEKMGKKKNIVDNLFTNYGNLMEEVSVMVFEKAFNTDVFCKNISLVDPNKVNSFIFSPDGICAMPIRDNEITIDEIRDDDKCCPVLIEIKNPWSRPIAQNGDIPTQYVPQIQAGLLAIPMLHGGIFIDCQTKLCSFNDLENDYGYNSVLHNGKASLDKDTEPLYKGMIAVRGKCPKDFWAKNASYINFNSKKIYDFSNMNYMNTLSILRAIRSGSMDAEYLPICEDVDELDNVKKDLLNKDDICGIISFKVFDISYTSMYRDSDIIHKIKTEISKYDNGDLDIDEDYVPRKRKRTSPDISRMPSLSFDSSSESDNKESYNINESSGED